MAEHEAHGAWEPEDSMVQAFFFFFLIQQSFIGHRCTKDVKKKHCSHRARHNGLASSKREHDIHKLRLLYEKHLPFGQGTDNPVTTFESIFQLIPKALAFPSSPQFSFFKKPWHSLFQILGGKLIILKIAR